MGKGIRGAPRDAIVADVTPPELRDAAFGLRQSLDTVGAFAGPLLAMLFLWLWVDNMRAVLWIAVIPAALAVLLLAVGIDEPVRHTAVEASTVPRLGILNTLPPAFWPLMLVTSLFSLARLSEAFLVLRAQELHLGLMWIPLVMIVMSAVYSLSSYPAGVWAARVGRVTLLVASLLALLAAEVALAWLPDGAGLWTGVALWGLHMGLSQGGLSAWVAELAPAGQRATAFGIFHFVTGLSQLAGGALTGWLWTRHGSPTAFAASGAWALMALVSLIGARRGYTGPTRRKGR
ncbi:MAG TPA: MFS transporter [Burkholderiaceae bacterium]|nr:MFS transporter [Burkholderiaceae bacterium]